MFAYVKMWKCTSANKKKKNHIYKIVLTSNSAQFPYFLYLCVCVCVSHRTVFSALCVHTMCSWQHSRWRSPLLILLCVQ